MKKAIKEKLAKLAIWGAGAYKWATTESHFNAYLIGGGIITLGMVSMAIMRNKNGMAIGSRRLGSLEPSYK